MIYNINFVGRKAGAIGICYKITDKIDAENETDFIKKLYKKYDNIFMLKVNGKLKNN